MAVELKFRRNDRTPWGFRLTGGVDVDAPLTVIKVKEGSLAEGAGLRVDDVIVKINGIPTAGLTHEEVHDVIVQAGDELAIIVQREEERMFNRNIEENIGVNGRIGPATNFRDSELRNARTSDKLNGETPDEKITEVISGHSELLPDQNVIGINFNNVNLSNPKVLETLHQNQATIPERRWSTFLQKPRGPKPVPKRKEPEQPKHPPYNPFKLPKKQKDNHPTTEVTVNVEQSSNVENENKIEEFEPQFLEDQSLEEPDPQELFLDEQTSSLPIESVEEEEKGEYGINYQVVNESEEHDEQQQETMNEESLKSECKAAAPYLKAIPSLEEQLAQVQKQLQALSHLPSSIQSTIDAVAQQLAQIASAANQTSSIRNEYSARHEQELNDEEFSERAPEESAEEDELAFGYSEGESEHEAIEKDEYQTYEDAYKEKKDREEIAGEGSISEDEDERESPSKPRELTAEEKEEIRREQEKFEKKQKEVGQLKESHQRRIEQRPTRALAPTQRPIILPGGRKWAQPNDATVSARPKKMTDEKIAETIETYSEVITGKLKGINFLKYTPPTRNLDYLQNSEVFRLLHEMEPTPRRGIAARPEIIPAVQDIYEKRTTNRGESLPLGMQR